MNAQPRSLSQILIATAAVVIILSLILLAVTQVLPGRAAWPHDSLAAITNQQKAAILGGQNLLLLHQQPYFLFLPATRK